MTKSNLVVWAFVLRDFFVIRRSDFVVAFQRQRSTTASTNSGLCTKTSSDFPNARSPCRRWQSGISRPPPSSWRGRLWYAAQRAEGIGLVTGPAGTGKTLLCQVLAEQSRGQLEVALLASGRFNTRRSLLQAILFELGLPYREMEEGDLRLSLIDHLSPRGGTSQSGLLLIVDEAHALPLRLLEELRLITNLVRNGQARVRLVLSGSPQLEERLASPKMTSFNQRVTARCYLECSIERRRLVTSRTKFSKCKATRKIYSRPTRWRRFITPPMEFLGW